MISWLYISNAQRRPRVSTFADTEVEVEDIEAAKQFVV